MINKVIDFLKKYELEDKTIVVGFSGGYDSMCLLDILSKIKNLPEFTDLTVIAAHFNHNWRGEESLKEQEVCRIFSNSRDVTFYTKTASKDIKKTENDARIARYEFFEEAYEEFDADAVFTAHNKDDNAETILYRIVKGTGTVGLKGISEKRRYFYRPLLGISRQEIVKYCNDNNLTPNEDSSNSNTAYKRNFLRLNIIPLLEQINHNVKDALNTLALNSITDNQIIEEYLQTIRPIVLDGNKIKSQEFIKLSPSVRLRLVYEYILNLGLDYDYKKIKEILDFINDNLTKRNGSTHSLASALWLYADCKTIETIPQRETSDITEQKPVMIDGVGEYEFNGKVFTIKEYEDDKLFIFPDSTSNFAYVDLTLVDFPLILRTRNDGDIITPFGMKSSMKLKKFMNSKGVSKHKRDGMTLLCSKDEVLWVAGVGLSSKIGVTDKPTHVIEVKEKDSKENLNE